MNDLYDALKEKIPKLVEKSHAAACEVSDYLAENPELSSFELKASKRIATFLKEHGFEVEIPFSGFGTAFKATYGPQNHRRKVAILVEYDALPEMGHACGHCVSGSISLLAGAAVKEFQDELDVDVHLIGTPAEETVGSKVVMARNKIFDPYDLAIMIHMYDKSTVTPKTFALNSYLYSFHGKAAHSAAAPWDGINAFNAVQLMFHAMDMLRQHVLPDVRMHGIIRHPGEAPGIVPELCSAEIFIRSLNRDYLNEVNRKVQACAEGAAIATGTTWDRQPTDNPFDNLRHNEAGARALREVYAELDVAVNDDPCVLFGSTDMGNVSYVCPAFCPTLALVDEGTTIHTKEFERGVHGKRAHDAIALGANILALSIAKVFSNETILRAIKEDFHASR